MDKGSANSFYRFLLVIRQACLLIAGWIESETNTRGAATGELRSSTDPEGSPLQFRRLTDEEMNAIADRISKRAMAQTLQHGRSIDSMNV